MLHAVGIDLGTTNSLMAWVNADGHTEMLRDRDGDLHIPSVVFFDDERVIVGKEAQLRARRKPYRLAACVKQDMGKRFYTQAIADEHLPPEVIQGCILRQLKEDVTRRLGSEYGVVIGVPAYFNDNQRRGTAEAAEMAGLPLLDVLNEPVAAALAFGEHLLLPHRDTPGGAYVIVYDLGGYTFEATLLHCEGESFTTLATDRENSLGGNDWDLYLADFLAEQFLTRHGVNLKTEPAGLDLLYGMTTRAKRALGVRPATTVSVPQSGGRVSITVARDEFERLTRDLLERTLTRTERVLNDAGMTWSDVSRVLLVGGATRMPMVRRMLQERSGLAPDQRVSSDEAVCRGAAIYAAHLLDEAGPTGTRPRRRIANISTHSVGIEGIHPQSGQKINRVLIPRGTPLPAKVAKHFTTLANAQRSISISVLEGDSQRPQHCVTIGRAVLRDLPADLTTQWPVEVTCEYGASGRLTVDARIRYTDRTVHLELSRPCGVSQVHLARWKTAVGTGAGFPVFQELAQLERRDEAAPPIAVAVSPPDEAARKEDGLMALLHRHLPFVFRGADHSGSPSDVK